MKGRSSKQLKEQEPQLSGAYIRSLVKQLTSSRTTMSLPTDQHECVDNGDKIESDVGRKNQPPQPPPHKKQVRRRLHTTRPYQERLLNMAEARREIVTALKYHRASMKQAGDHHHSSPEPESAAAATVKSRRNPRIYPSNTSNNFTSYNDQSFGYPTFPHHHPPLPAPPATAYGWPIPPPSDPLNFALPNQTLGLNLNFHDFNNIDKYLYQSTTASAVTATNPLLYSTSSPSSSSSQSISITTEEIPNSSSVSFSQTEEIPDSRDVAVLDGLYPVMDDEEMAEIRSIGEKHQMEWNDTMNLMTSAWWFKVLKPEEEESLINNPFKDDQLVMEFPAWLNINDQQQHQDNCFHQDPALPWLDIGDIEGMDGEWLS